MAFDMHRMLWPVYFLAIIQNAETGGLIFLFPPFEWPGMFSRFVR